MSQTEPEKAVSVQLKWPVCVRDICCPSADCTSVFWFCNVLQLWCFSGRLLCFLLWFGVTGRGSQNYKSLYLFICHCVSTCPFFHAAALFPKLTNVLRLIEYDPLTAVWNNEASFPLHSPPGWPLSPALQSTSKCLISVESGAEGNIDHTESPSVHIYCFCTEGEVALWSPKLRFQTLEMILFGVKMLFGLFVRNKVEFKHRGVWKGAPKVIHNLWAIIEYFDWKRLNLRAL